MRYGWPFSEKNEIINKKEKPKSADHEITHKFSEKCKNKFNQFLGKNRKVKHKNIQTELEYQEKCVQVELDADKDERIEPTQENDLKKGHQNKKILLLKRDTVCQNKQILIVKKDTEVQTDYSFHDKSIQYDELAKINSDVDVAFTSGNDISKVYQSQEIFELQNGTEVNTNYNLKDESIRYNELVNISSRVDIASPIKSDFSKVRQNQEMLLLKKDTQLQTVYNLENKCIEYNDLMRIGSHVDFRLIFECEHEYVSRNVSREVLTKYDHLLRSYGYILYQMYASLALQFPDYNIAQINYAQIKNSSQLLSANNEISSQNNKFNKRYWKVDRHDFNGPPAFLLENSNLRRVRPKESKLYIQNIGNLDLKSNQTEKQNVNPILRDITYNIDQSNQRREDNKKSFSKTLSADQTSVNESNELQSKTSYEADLQFINEHKNIRFIFKKPKLNSQEILIDTPREGKKDRKKNKICSKKTCLNTLVDNNNISGICAAKEIYPKVKKKNEKQKLTVINEVSSKILLQPSEDLQKMAQDKLTAIRPNAPINYHNNKEYPVKLKSEAVKTVNKKYGITTYCNKKVYSVTLETDTVNLVESKHTHDKKFISLRNIKTQGHDSKKSLKDEEEGSKEKKKCPVQKRSSTNKEIPRIVSVERGSVSPTAEYKVISTESFKKIRSISNFSEEDAARNKTNTKLNYPKTNANLEKNGSNQPKTGSKVIANPRSEKVISVTEDSTRKKPTTKLKYQETNSNVEGKVTHPPTTDYTDTAKTSSDKVLSIICFKDENRSRNKINYSKLNYVKTDKNLAVTNLEEEEICSTKVSYRVTSTASSAEIISLPNFNRNDTQNEMQFPKFIHTKISKETDANDLQESKVSSKSCYNSCTLENANLEDIYVTGTKNKFYTTQHSKTNKEILTTDKRKDIDLFVKNCNNTLLANRFEKITIPKKFENKNENKQKDNQQRYLKRSNESTTKMPKRGYSIKYIEYKADSPTKNNYSKMNKDFQQIAPSEQHTNQQNLKKYCYNRLCYSRPEKKIVDTKIEYNSKIDNANYQKNTKKNVTGPKNIVQKVPTETQVLRTESKEMFNNNLKQEMAKVIKPTISPTHATKSLKMENDFCDVKLGVEKQQKRIIIILEDSVDADNTKVRRRHIRVKYLKQDKETHVNIPENCREYSHKIDRRIERCNLLPEPNMCCELQNGETKYITNIEKTNEKIRNNSKFLISNKSHLKVVPENTICYALNSNGHVTISSLDKTKKSTSTKYLSSSTDNLQHTDIFQDETNKIDEFCNNSGGVIYLMHSTSSKSIRNTNEKVATSNKPFREMSIRSFERSLRKLHLNRAATFQSSTVSIVDNRDTPCKGYRKPNINDVKQKYGSNLDDQHLQVLFKKCNSKTVTVINKNCKQF